jgi:hypothetical protein
MGGASAFTPTHPPNRTERSQQVSTKIYDGMIATDHNALEVGNRIRAVIEPIFKQKYFDAVDRAHANVGMTWADVFHLHGTGKLKEKWDFPIEDNLYETPRHMYHLIQELRDFPTWTYTEYDFGYSVSILENGNGIACRPLVLLFSEAFGKEYRQALEDAGVVEEYGYWNNTDQPDYLTDAQWDEREKAWDKLDVPADQGFIIPILSKNTLIGEYIYRKIEPLVE